MYTVLIASNCDFFNLGGIFGRFGVLLPNFIRTPEKHNDNDDNILIEKFKNSYSKF